MNLCCLQIVSFTKNNMVIKIEKKSCNQMGLFFSLYYFFNLISHSLSLIQLILISHGIKFACYFLPNFFVAFYNFNYQKLKIDKSIWRMKYFIFAFVNNSLIINADFNNN